MESRESQTTIQRIKPALFWPAFWSFPIDVLISDLIVAFYETLVRPTEHFRFYYHETPFIIYYNRPTLRTREEDKAVNFVFETFVDVSIAKNATSSKFR